MSNMYSYKFIVIVVINPILKRYDAVAFLPNEKSKVTFLPVFFFLRYLKRRCVSDVVEEQAYTLY